MDGYFFFINICVFTSSMSLAYNKQELFSIHIGISIQWLYIYISITFQNQLYSL